MVGRSISGALIVNVAIAVPLWTGALIWGAVARPEIATLLTLLALLAYGTMTASGSAMETYLRSLRQVRLVVGVSILEKSLLLAALLVVALIDAGLVGIGVAYLAAGLTPGSASTHSSSSTAGASRPGVRGGELRRSSPRAPRSRSRPAR